MKKTVLSLRLGILLLTLVVMTSTVRAELDLSEFSRSCEALSQNVSPAVVQIIVMGYDTGLPGSPSTGDLLAKRRSSGSGVIVDPAGYIITNAHVVGGARKIQVILVQSGPDSEAARSILKPSGSRIGASLVGLDRETDLAVLKIQGENFPFLEMGDSDDLRQGQLVFAYGSPFGLENSVTMGVVSSVARQLTPEDPMIYVQTDATINPGNSGGPLVSMDGLLIGINTLIFSKSGGSDGIGFAAPINIVSNVYHQIKEFGRVRRGQIGVGTQTITPLLARGLSLTADRGVIISDVSPNSPAEATGLNEGDIILQMDGKQMENARQFDVNLYRFAVGESVRLKILRGSDTLHYTVPIVERPDDPDRFSQLVTPGKNLVRELGILVLDLDRAITRMLPSLRYREGVVVAAQAADAPIVQQYLYPGDVIYHLNSTRIRNLGDLKNVLKTLGSGDPAIVHVERRGELMYIPFELE